MGRPAKKSLRTVLRYHTLRSALVPLLVVELSLLAIYFGFGERVAGRWRTELLDALRQNLAEVCRDRAAQLSARLGGIEAQTDLIRVHTQQLFSGEVAAMQELRKEDYARGRGGALYQVEDDGGASIFYAATTELGEPQWAKVALTEALDPTLAATVRHDPHVVAAYLNTADGFNRYFPFIPKAADQFPPNMDMRKYAFFYEADALHNPSRAPTWTDTYLDPAGGGWMVSSIAPAYRGDVLEGVVGVDVTVPRLASLALDLEVSYEAPALLLTRDGVPLALNHAAAERFPKGRDLLGSVGVHDVTSEQKLGARTTLAELLGDDDAGHHLASALGSEADDGVVSIGGESFLVTHATVAQTGWRLAVLVRRADVVQPVVLIEEQTRNVGLGIIAAMAAFYAMFFLWVYRSSRELADGVGGPLEALMQASRDRSRPRVETGIRELDELGSSFGEMVALTEEQRERLEVANRDLEEQVERALQRVREREDVLLAQTHRLAAGSMVASIAHQWRQPLMAAQLLVDELHLEAGETASLRMVADEMGEAVAKMNTVVNEFAEVFRDGHEQASEPMALMVVVRRALSMADGALKEAGLVVQVLREGDVEGRSVPFGLELTQALSSLLAFVTEAISDAGADKRLSVRVRAENEASSIEVSWLSNAAVAEVLLDVKPLSVQDATGRSLGVHLCRRLVERRWNGTLDPLPERDGLKMTLPAKDLTLDVPPETDGGDESAGRGAQVSSSA